MSFSTQSVGACQVCACAWLMHQPLEAAGYCLVERAAQAVCRSHWQGKRSIQLERQDNTWRSKGYAVRLRRGLTTPSSGAAVSVEHRPVRKVRLSMRRTSAAPHLAIMLPADAGRQCGLPIRVSWLVRRCLALPVELLGGLHCRLLCSAQRAAAHKAGTATHQGPPGLMQGGAGRSEGLRTSGPGKSG